MPETLRFIIRSDFAEAREVQTAILDCLERHHYVTDALFGIKLALEEGLINAIKHGNKFDRNKTVRIEAAISDQRADLSIEDEGAGFDRATVPDPTLDENLDRLHGRGILLMESYMDSVSWSRSGRRIHLTRSNKVMGEAGKTNPAA